jgi:hypothetical protein
MSNVVGKHYTPEHRVVTYFAYNNPTVMVSESKNLELFCRIALQPSSSHH